jgi:hypothetical protein
MEPDTQAIVSAAVALICGVAVVGLMAWAVFA